MLHSSEAYFATLLYSTLHTPPRLLIIFITRISQVYNLRRLRHRHAAHFLALVPRRERGRGFLFCVAAADHLALVEMGDGDVFVVGVFVLPGLEGLHAFYLSDENFVGLKVRGGELLGKC